MPLWQFEPTARPSDTRWEDHPVYGEVIVRAASAAEARLVAGRSLCRTDTRIQFGGDRDTIFSSAFDDEKLYAVRQMRASGSYTLDGPLEVLAARLALPA